MGEITIRDGVTKREIQVPTLREDVEIHVDKDRIVVPVGMEVVLEDDLPKV